EHAWQRAVGPLRLRTTAADRRTENTGAGYQRTGRQRLPPRADARIRDVTDHRDDRPAVITVRGHCVLGSAPCARGRWGVDRYRRSHALHAAAPWIRGLSASGVLRRLSDDDVGRRV